MPTERGASRPHAASLPSQYTCASALLLRVLTRRLIIIGVALLTLARGAIGQSSHDPARECWAASAATPLPGTLPGSWPGIGDSYPLGNGRLGALWFGGVVHDSIPIADRAAGGLVGNLLLQFEGRTAATTYERSLALDRAVAAVRYRVGDTAFTRECYVSRPDQVLVLRLTADKGGRISVGISFDAGPGGMARAVGEDTLVLAGTHSLRVGVQRSGGKFNATDEAIQVIKANSVTIVLASDKPGENGAARADEDVSYALRRGYNELRDRHTADATTLFNRCMLELPAGEGSGRETGQRLRDPTNDPALPALQFAACRYLMIAGFRAGGSSPSVLWSERHEPRDASAFLACEGINLAECHEPLLAFAEMHAGDENPTELTLRAGMGLWRRYEHSRSAKHLARALPPIRLLAERLLASDHTSATAREFLARSADACRAGGEDAALLARLESLGSGFTTETTREALDAALSRRWGSTPSIFGEEPGATLALANNFTDALARVRTPGETPEIDLLPAIPHAWREGRVRGLRLPGGHRVDLTWTDGRIKSARVSDSVLSDVGVSPDPDLLRSAAVAGGTTGVRVRVVRKKGEERFTLEIVTPDAPRDR